MPLTGTYFNSSYYLTQNNDVANKWGGTALQHYTAFGASENRAPNSWFNAQYYRAAYADLGTMTAVQLFEHYENFGYKETRTPSSTYANFNEALYLSTYADLGKANITTATALNHYLVFGANENRIAKNDDGTTISGSGTVSGTTYTLTVNTDTVTGSAGNDTVDGSGYFNPGTGTYIQTLNNNDNINAGAGTDTLNVILNTATATTLPASLVSVEVINLTNTVGTNILDLANATGVTTLNSTASATQIAQFNNVQSAPTAFGLTNTAVGMTANILNSALAGTADAATLTLTGVTAGTVTLQTITAASGYETLNVVSAGSAANVLTGLTDGLGTSLATINCSGAIALNLGVALDNSVTKVDASAMTAALTVITGTSAIAVTGGTGNDSITLGATYTTADTINGGAGTDTLSVTTAMVNAVSTSQTNISNIENISISDAVAATTLTMGAWGGATTFTYAFASANNTTVNYLAGTNGLVFATAYTGVSTISCAGSATTDVLNLTVGTSAAGNVSNGAFNSSGFETINISSLGSANTLGAISMTVTAASETVAITGAVGLTLGILTADVLNASAFTGALTMVTGTVAAGGIVITGGSAADTLFGSATADNITGGAGADSITGGSAVAFGGADILTGGTGFDSFFFYGSTASAATYATDPNITDFTVGATRAASDQFQISGGNFFTAAGNAGLASGGGAAGTLVPIAAPVVQTVVQNAGAAFTASVDFIKLSTGVAAAATNQLTFNAAIGTAIITGFGADTSYAGSFYDTTNSKAVIFEVLSTLTTNTSIETGDVIRVLGTIDMTAADYATFGANQLVICA